MTRITSIKGGADPCVAAAIAATIAHVEDADAETRATRPPIPRPSHWAQSSRPRENTIPLPSHLYDATPWSDLGDSNE